MTTAQIRRFRRSLRQFERLNTYQLKSCCSGVTFAQCLVILQIDEVGRPSMGDLAAGLRLDNSTLTRTIDGLVARELVERFRDESDRRTVRIALTTAGRRVCKILHNEGDDCVRKLFERIPPGRRAVVVRSFEMLVEAFLGWETEQD